jgi:uncharacterized membrane protein YgdD (TMEM256/DUF423 family)
LLIGTWLTFAGSLAIIFLGAFFLADPGGERWGGLCLLVGSVLFLASLIAFTFLPIVKPKRIEDGMIHLKGVCEDFLRSLPEWTSR